jgi:O-antigen/teichoic acid export membrane protein
MALETTGSRAAAALRSQRLARSAIAGIGARAVHVACSLLLVRVLFGEFGAARYGVWLTMTSLLFASTFADLGLGSGLLSSLAAAHGKDDLERARRLISSALVTVVAFSSVFVLLTGAAVLVPLGFDDAPAAAGELTATLAVCVGYFAFVLPAALLEKIVAAWQRTDRNGYSAAIGALASLVAAMAAVQVTDHMALIAVAVFAPRVLASYGNGLHFLASHPTLRPRLHLADRATALRTARLGLVFFLLQLTTFGAFHCDHLIVTLVLGAATTPQYSVPLQLFNFVPAFVWAALAPMWPAYAEALERHDILWAKRAYRRACTIVVGVNLPVAVGLVFAAPMLLEVWLGRPLETTVTHRAGLGAWIIIQGLLAVATQLLHGLAAFRFQLSAALAMAALNLPLTLVLTRAVGPEGPIHASILAVTIAQLIPAWVLLARSLRVTGPS